MLNNLKSLKKNFTGNEQVHIKTGNHYVIKDVVLNCTNEQDGLYLVLYSPVGESDTLFARELGEFMQKFKAL